MPDDAADHAACSEADRYLAEASASMTDRYLATCVDHACALAVILIRHGFQPWIGRIHEVLDHDGQPHHAPLRPLRFAGRGAPTWNTHYVCCFGDEVLDPLIGERAPIEGFTMRIFGREIALTEHLSASETVELASRGELRAAFRIKR